MLSKCTVNSLLTLRRKRKPTLDCARSSSMIWTKSSRFMASSPHIKASAGCGVFVYNIIHLIFPFIFFRADKSACNISTIVWSPFFMWTESSSDYVYYNTYLHKMQMFIKSVPACKCRPGPWRIAGEIRNPTYSVKYSFFKLS